MCAVPYKHISKYSVHINILNAVALYTKHMTFVMKIDHADNVNAFIN